jgi:hypothetical protein
MAMRETISTLKFAERAKKIKNKAVVNEDGDERAFQKKYLELLKQMELMKNGAIQTLPHQLSSNSNQIEDGSKDSYTMDFHQLSQVIEKVQKETKGMID